MQMEQYRIINIQERPDMMQRAAEWFYKKWKISQQIYLDSMTESLDHDSVVPQWYIACKGKTILAGLGVVENDFHKRKDLSPNVCAAYVEEAYRKQGIAGAMLKHVCKDFKEKGIDTLYLITDHTSFYERYGWRFLCMVEQNDGPAMTRMYVHPF